MKRKETGFSLIEMLAALVIVGILFAAAGPSIRGIFTSNRMATHLNQLSTAILFARSEAIKRVVPVAVGQTGTWAGGWNVWIDNVVADGFLTPNEPILRAGGASATTITLVGSHTAIVYQPDGTIQVPVGVGTTPTVVPVGVGGITFTLCYTGQLPRILTISNTGKSTLNAGAVACP